MVEFAIGMAAAATVMSSVAMGDVIKAFMAVTAGLMATVSLVLVSKLIKPGETLKAIGGLLAAAALVAVGVVGFSFAVATAAQIMSTVSWEDTTKAFAAVGFGILATIALVLVGSALAQVAPTMLPAGLALLAAAVFVGVSLIGFAYAIKFANEVIKDIPLERVEQIFKMAGIAVLATIALALAGVQLAASIPAMLLGMLGLTAAAVFFTVGVLGFGAALDAIVDRFPDVDVGRVEEILEIIERAVTASFGMLFAGGVFAALAVLSPIALAAAALGIIGLALFFSAVMPLFIPAVQAVADMPMANAEETSAKIGAIGAIIQAMAAIGKLGIDAAAAATAAGAVGPGISKTIDAMSGFIRSTKDTIVSLVTDLATMALSWSKEDLDKVKVMADLVSGIASMASAMAGPMSALASADTGWLQDDSGERLKAIVDGISSIMDAMRLQLPTIVHAMANVSLGEKEISFTKIKKISEIMKAIGPLMQTVSGMVRDIAGIKGDGIGETDAAEKMGTIGTTIQNIFDAISLSFPGIITMVANLSGTFANLKDLPSTVSSMVETIKGVISAVKELVSLDLGGNSGFLKGLFEEKQNSLGDVFGKVRTDLDSVVKGTDFLNTDMIAKLQATSTNLASFRDAQLGSLVSAVVEDIKAINDSLASLGDVDVNATVDHLGEALQLKTEVLNIERKPIQMTVNLNLTMKAEDIAKEILEVSQKATLKSDSKLYHQVRDFLNIS